MLTAFYAVGDLMAMTALRALYQAKVRVPEDIAVIGMSNIEMSQYANPLLTTINVPTHARDGYCRCEDAGGQNTGRCIAV